MKYTKGTVSATNGSQVVIGTGTKWLGKIRPGYLFTVSGGVHYAVAAVVSDTELRLAPKFTQTTQAGSAYTIYSDFTEYYSIPYPSGTDLYKADILRRAVRLIDSLIDGIDRRVTAVEFPALSVSDSLLVPTMGSVSVQVSYSYSVADSDVETSMSALAIQVGLPNAYFVTNSLVTPTMDPVSIVVGSELTLAVDDSIMMSAMSALAVPYTEALTADDNDVTADSANATADGSSMAGRLYLGSIDAVVSMSAVGISTPSGLTVTVDDSTMASAMTVLALSVFDAATTDSAVLKADANNVTADGLIS